MSGVVSLIAAGVLWKVHVKMWTLACAPVKYYADILEWTQRMNSFLEENIKTLIKLYK